MLTFNRKYVFQKDMADTFMPKIEFKNPNLAPSNSNAFSPKRLPLKK